jgi:hypothetical protein
MQTFAIFVRPVMSDGSLQRDAHDGWRFVGLEDDLGKVLEAQTECVAENGEDSCQWFVLDYEAAAKHRALKTLRPDIAEQTPVDPEGA